MNRTSRKSSGALASLLKSSVCRLPERLVQTLSERSVRRRIYYYTQKKIKCKIFFCNTKPLTRSQRKGLSFRRRFTRRHAHNRQTSRNAEKAGLLGEPLPTRGSSVSEQKREQLCIFIISVQKKNVTVFQKTEKYFLFYRCPTSVRSYRFSASFQIKIVEPH